MGSRRQSRRAKVSIYFLQQLCSPRPLTYCHVTVTQLSHDYTLSSQTGPQVPTFTKPNIPQLHSDPPPAKVIQIQSQSTYRSSIGHFGSHSKTIGLRLCGFINGCSLQKKSGKHTDHPPSLSGGGGGTPKFPYSSPGSGPHSSFFGGGMGGFTMATGSVGEAGGSEGAAAAGKLKSLQRTSRYAVCAVLFQPHCMFIHPESGFWKQCLI